MTTLLKSAALGAFFMFGLIHTVGAQDTMNISIDCMDGEPGEVLCFPIIVENFTDILSLQLPIIYDPAVLKYVGVQNQVLASAVASNPGPSDVRYIWVDLNVLGVTLPDGSVLFEICFEVIGLPGSTSEVNIVTTHDLEVEASNLTSELEVNVMPCTVNVPDPNALGAYISSCGSPDGVLDGSFTVTAFGGMEPYTYTWMGPASGSSNLTNAGDSESQNVPIGVYSIEVTDNAGNTVVLSAEVLAQGFLSAVSSFDPTCFDFTNGRITTEVANGAAPYGIIWRSLTDPNRFGSGFINMSGGVFSINSLPGGRYEVELSDNNGCTTLDTVTLVVDSFDISATIMDATCIGANNGSIEITVTGSTPINGMDYDMSFSWGGSITTDMFNSGPVLDPGNYTITISDAVNQCDTVFAFTVGAQIDFNADVTVVEPSCPGAADGEITIGTQPPVTTNTYQLFDSNAVLLDTEPPGNTTAVFTGLTAGEYGITIDDGTCQSDTILVVLTDPADISVDTTNISPAGCLFTSMDGEISVEASGGFLNPGSDYQYDWTGARTGSTITGLNAGNYTVTVTDDNGCTTTATFAVGTLPGPQIDSIVATNISCNNDPVTTLEVFFTLGSSALDGIIWRDQNGTPVGNGSVIMNQTAGYTLDIIISDDGMCFDVLNNYVGPGGSDLTIDSIRLQSPACPGDNNGQITVFVTGGVAPYTYIWSTGDTSSFNLYAGLTAGDYSVTVVDADSCGIVDTMFTLMEDMALNFNFVNIDSAGCGVACNGAATLMPAGGDPGLPYDFFWANGLMETGSQSTSTGLCGGWETVTITQDNLCFFTDSVFIPLPADVMIIADTVADVSCSGTDNGFIELSATGGNGSFTYIWDALPNGPVQNGLSAGTYYVTVSDTDLCTAMDSFSIVEPEPIALQLDSTTLRLIGCTGDSNGVIGYQVIGGTPPFDYNWSPNSSTGPLAQQLGPGTYFVTVTDNAGCTDSASYTLNEPQPIQSTIAPVLQPQCVGETTEVFVESVTGGNEPYLFSINGGEQYPIDSVINLPIGFYNVIVFDQGGCADTTQISVTAPPAIILELFPESPVVDLGDSVLLELSISNTQGPVDSIIWAHDESGQLSCYDCASTYASNVIPVTYFVQVIDSAGCLAEIQVLVDVNTQRNVYFPNVFTPNNDGRNEDFMIFTGSGVTMINSVRVFNRWGEMMNEVRDLPPSTDGHVVWDGEYRGRQMQPGVYVFVAEIQFADRPDDPIIFKGDITLIR